MRVFCGISSQGLGYQNIYHVKRKIGLNSLLEKFTKNPLKLKLKGDFLLLKCKQNNASCLNNDGFDRLEMYTIRIQDEVLNKKQM